MVHQRESGMRSRHRAVGLVGAAWIVAVGGARAQQPPPVESRPPAADSITVHGERVEPISLPGSLGGEEISALRIERLPATNAAEIVGFLPGIRVQERVQGERAAVSIDGLPPEYSKLLLNGMRYAGEIGAAGDLADLPIAGVERIEVLRGPQALRYGADAAGGVVNVVTRPALAEPGARLELDSRLGEQGILHATHAGEARVGNLGATWNALHDQIDGFEPRGSDALWISAGPDSRRRIEDGYSTLAYSLGETTRLVSDLGWRFDREDLKWRDGAPTRRRDYARRLGSIGAEHTTAGGTSARARLRFFDGRTDSEVGRPFEMREGEWSIDAGLERELDLFAATHLLALDVDAERPAIDLDEGGLSAEDLGDLEEVDPRILGGASVDERFALAGLSASLETPLGPWITLDIALRSQLHSRFAERVLPQVALRFAPTDSLRLRLGWGLGYRTPTLRDLYQPPVTQNGGAYFLAGNPDLSAESTAGWRLGLEYESPERVVQLGAALFGNRVEDHIRSVFAGDVRIGTRRYTRTRPSDDPLCRHLPPDHPRCVVVEEVVEPVTRSLFRKANLDRLRTRGLEAQILLRPAPELSLRLGYTFLRTRVQSPLLLVDELPNEPRHTFDLEGMATLPYLDTELALRARWRDEAIPERSGTGLVSFQDPLARTDRSWILDLRLRQPLRENLELYVDLLNLTDEKSVDSYEIRPRRIAVGATLRLNGL
jgi:outer membrane receptor for ferrienterochelin and colicins